MNEEEQEEYEFQKVLETMMVLNKHFAQYIKESDPELFKRAIDYAKTFTEQDVHGIQLNYLKDDEDQNETEQD